MNSDKIDKKDVDLEKDGLTCDIIEEDADGLTCDIMGDVPEHFVQAYLQGEKTIEEIVNEIYPDGSSNWHGLLKQNLKDKIEHINPENTILEKEKTESKDIKVKPVIPSIPTSFVKEAERNAITDIAKQMKELEHKLQTILLSKGKIVVHCSWEGEDTKLALPIDHPLFLELLTFFYFSSSLDYGRKIKLDLWRNARRIFTFNRRCRDLVSEFKLSTLIDTIRVKNAIYNQIKKSLSNISDYREMLHKHKEGDKENNISELVFGLTKLHNTDAAKDIEELKDHIKSMTLVSR